jgi:molecular chaperone GrpE
MAEEHEPTSAAPAGLNQPESDNAANTGTPHAVESITSLEAMLKSAELKAEEHHDAWLRAKAESDNVRKRAALDVTQARKYAIESFAAELLPVADSLEAALAIENATLESYRAGMEITLKQLKSAFEKFNVVEINPLDARYDPHQHQAISVLESDAAPNSVLSVLQKGYLLNERVLRAALVTVAKPAGAH